jgi:hypothetical protein
MADAPKTTTFTFRTDAELKNAFVKAAKEKNRNAAILLRDFMLAYVAEHQSKGETAPSNKPKKS